MRILLESRIRRASGSPSAWRRSATRSIVADPGYAAMYGARTRRVKTDRRDVAALATACSYGHLPGARTGWRRRRVSVGSSCGFAGAARADTDRDRQCLARDSPPAGRARAARSSRRRCSRGWDRLGLDASLTALLAPLVQVTSARWPPKSGPPIAGPPRPRADETTARLMTVPGVGPITALTYAATLDTPNRFAGDAARASAYVGLVPRGYSSGERQHRGRITKTGPPTVPGLLVQAAWSIWIRPGAAGCHTPCVGDSSCRTPRPPRRDRRFRPPPGRDSLCRLAGRGALSGGAARRLTLGRSRWGGRAAS